MILLKRGVSVEHCQVGTWVWVFAGSLFLILLFLG